MESLDLVANINDISSYSNFDKICQSKIKIVARIDFNTRRIYGSADFTFKVLNKDEKRVILDAKSITVSAVREKSSNKPLEYSFYEENPDKDALGTPLIILLDDIISDELELTIDFSSTEESAAIQWLTAEQTHTGKYPFMFTQCEAILARTLIPCQDTPSAKVTVEVALTVEKPLRALFSGVEVRSYDVDQNLITYEYVQNIAIPTYLIAIACGELEFGKLSERCGIWTEVGLNEKAVWEFANTEDFLCTAEKYLTPYVWGVYNILVLPFAFPYGGMENPCLTFVTNALIAGDRSMTNVIAHEIAHSWTGNLVTNKDWANFWMNEGFTTFMERKICELMHGEEMSNLEARVGVDELKYAVNSYGEKHNFTTLAPDFKNIDPDDAFSVVPYEKGFTFLYFLETLIGKDNFQKIFQIYINKFALKSISHVEYRGVFEEEVKKIYGGDEAAKILDKIDWDSWINKPGYPLMSFEFKSKWVDEAIDLAEQFLKSKFNKEENNENVLNVFKNWHTNVKLVFLGYLNDRIELIDENIYSCLKDILKLNEGYNAEVKHIWFQIAMKTHHEDAIPHMQKFLLTHGRMKYIRPVYYSWYPFQKEACLNFFDKNKQVYHPIAVRLIEKKFASWNC